MPTIGEFVAHDIMPSLSKRLRDEMVAMIRRVASRETDENVSKRLREIADAFAGAKL